MITCGKDTDLSFLVPLRFISYRCNGHSLRAVSASAGRNELEVVCAVRRPAVQTGALCIRQSRSGEYAKNK